MSEKQNQIIYETGKSLIELLVITCEIENEIGIIPSVIINNGKKILYNKTDAMLLRKNKISEAEYLKKHEI